jgi:hypothetical protein
VRVLSGADLGTAHPDNLVALDDDDDDLTDPVDQQSTRGGR